jgi:colanic acid biosynthesis glycosyl transferase WcaI
LIGSSRLRGDGGSLQTKVLIYGMNYAPEMAGVGRYTGELGQYLASLGHDVTVITTPPHYPGWVLQKGQAGNRWSKEIVAGARVYRCPLYLNPDMSGLKRLMAPLSFAISSAPIALAQAIWRRPKVVVAIEPTVLVAPIALLAAKLVGARTVLHVQDLEIDAAFAVGHLKRGGGLLPRLADNFEKAVMRRFDRVITIAHAMAARIAEKGVAPDKIRYFRNWVDLDRVKPVPKARAYREELGIDYDDFVVLYSGNIGAKQGVRLLIEAAQALARFPKIVFLIAGEGPMRREAERAAAQLPNIRVLDFQPEERFSDFLGVADVHVLPQERETADLLLPSKLGGMLASGRRIIATADRGTELADFLGDSCVLTPPGDAAALSVAIQTMAAAPFSTAEQAERLKRAASLSKTVVIRDFARAIMFETDNDAGQPSPLPVLAG